MIELGKIYNEDCLETMRRMPDKSVDLIVTDPPYGIGLEYGVISDTQEYLKHIIQTAVPEMLRVGKRCAVTTGVLNQFLYPTPTWSLAWFHGGGTASSSWGFSLWQPILVYGPDPYLANGLGRGPDALFKNESMQKNGHPCPKPVQFWSWLVNRCSMQGETVYDPFMGSGTTAVACERLGRNWIGSEINPEYVKIAEKRIANERAQIKMSFM